MSWMRPPVAAVRSSGSGRESKGDCADAIAGTSMATEANLRMRVTTSGSDGREAVEECVDA